MATTLKEGAELINKSLKNLGYEYQIDLTSDETITQGLEIVGAYTPTQRNAIMEQMNIIIQTRNYGVMFDSSANKWRAFLVDLTEDGFGIEDIFHELLEGIEPLWDKKGNEMDIYTDLVSYDENKIHKAFHTASKSREFKTTIDKRNYEKVFTRSYITRYIDTKLANMSWSAEYFLQNTIIEIVKNMVSDKKIVFSTGYNINNRQGIANIVESIKATVEGFKTTSKLYNYGVYDKSINEYRPVINKSNSKDDIFIITTPDYMQRIKVQGYSNAFNLSEYELDGRILYAPSGTNLGEHNGEEVQFIVVDKRAVVAGIKFWAGSNFFVPNVFRTNNFLNVDILTGYNTFFNAVAFTGEKADKYVENVKNGNLILDVANGNYNEIRVIVDGREIAPDFSVGDDYATAVIVGEIVNIICPDTNEITFGGNSVRTSNITIALTDGMTIKISE